MWQRLYKELEREIYIKIIATIIPTSLVTSSLSSFSCPSYKPKKKSNFQEDGGLVTRNSFPFYLQRVALYLKGMPNSIDFYKGIFLHVISVCIIVP